MEETTEPRQFSIRLPQDVREYLHNCANRHGRSLNSEILKRLEYSISIENYSEKPLMNYAQEKDLMYENNLNRMDDARLVKELMTIRETLEYMSSDKYSTNMVKMVIRYLAKRL